MVEATVTHTESAPTRRTARIEYRVERIPFTAHPEEHLAELVERLNELGRDGWRAIGIELKDQGLYYPPEQLAPPRPVLLMREVVD